MRQKQGLAWGAVGTGIVLWLVGSVALFSSGASAAWFLTATPTPDDIVLFQDDFETYSNRWLESRSPKSSAAYGDGVLNLRVVSPGVSLWSRPDFTTTLNSYRIQVTAEFRGGSLDSFIGLVLGYQSDDDFYALMVSPQGDWRYVRCDQQDWIDLTPPDALPVALAADQSLIRLQADVAADALTLTIDDRLAGRVVLSGELSGGTFGVIVRAGHGFADVTFDDVMVTYSDEVPDRE